MSEIEIGVLSIALAMDAMSVSIVSAMTTRKNFLMNAFKTSLCFGFFQSLMPILGYYFGDFSNETIKSVGHWISFCLLVVIGCDMIVKALKEEEVKSTDSLIGLFVLAIATSLDAFAVGITFAFLKVSLIQAISMIGIITFALCFLVFMVASKIMNNYQKQSQILGGVILIIIALKIIIPHIIF